MPAAPPEPLVRGESDFDRVSSLLLAVILGAAMIFGWLALVYVTNQAYQRRVTAPLEIIDVSGGGGGTPEGQVGGIETVQVPGGAMSRASNNEEEAAVFEEASVRETPAAMLDTVSEAGQASPGRHRRRDADRGQGRDGPTERRDPATGRSATASDPATAASARRTAGRSSRAPARRPRNTPASSTP